LLPLSHRQLFALSEEAAGTAVRGRRLVQQKGWGCREGSPPGPGAIPAQPGAWALGHQSGAVPGIVQGWDLQHIQAGEKREEAFHPYSTPEQRETS